MFFKFNVNISGDSNSKWIFFFDKFDIFIFIYDNFIFIGSSIAGNNAISFNIVFISSKKWFFIYSNISKSTYPFNKNWFFYYKIIIIIKKFVKYFIFIKINNNINNNIKIIIYIYFKY